ncbi:MAG: hypothetical protein K2O85_00580 [Helicobacter sp.]|nr:hypothetical protein [Helicobacter sp.]
MKQVLKDIDSIESMEIRSHNVINATGCVSQPALQSKKLCKTQLDNLLEESLASNQPFWLRFSRYNDAIIDAMRKQQS